MRLLLGMLVSLFVVQQAEAKPARCYTSDDGYYNCNFRGFDGNGSFVISAPNRPTITLTIVRTGVAYGSADFGTGRVVNLPGPYLRSLQDRSCWVNNATQDKVCAW